MKTLVIKNFRSISEWGYTEVIANFRNFDCIEEVPTHEVSGKQKYRVTLYTVHKNYDLRNLDKMEADRLIQRLLDFSRCDTKGETLIVTADPDKLTIEET